MVHCLFFKHFLFLVAIEVVTVEMMTVQQLPVSCQTFDYQARRPRKRRDLRRLAIVVARFLGSDVMRAVFWRGSDLSLRGVF